MWPTYVAMVAIAVIIAVWLEVRAKHKKEKREATLAALKRDHEHAIAKETRRKEVHRRRTPEKPKREYSYVAPSGPTTLTPRMVPIQRPVHQAAWPPPVATQAPVRDDAVELLEAAAVGALVGSVITSAIDSMTDSSSTSPSDDNGGITSGGGGGFGGGGADASWSSND